MSRRTWEREGEPPGGEVAKTERVDIKIKNGTRVLISREGGR